MHGNTEEELSDIVTRSGGRAEDTLKTLYLTRRTLIADSEGARAKGVREGNRQEAG